MHPFSLDRLVSAHVMNREDAVLHPGRDKDVLVDPITIEGDLRDRSLVHCHLLDGSASVDVPDGD